MSGAVDLLVVIVNYRTAAVTLDCLRSLEAEVKSFPGVARVVLADNCSPDDSYEVIARAIDAAGWSWCAHFRTAKNGGFSYGNNRAIEHGVAKWGPARHILHLNSDTVVGAGCLAQSLAIMDADPTIGAMSARLLNADGTNQSCTRRFPSPLRLAAISLKLPWLVPGLFGDLQLEYTGLFASPVSRDVDWVAGAYLWMRGDLHAKIGGLSERFFFYGEDVELCHRIHRAGYRVRYEAGPTTTHLGGASSDPTRMAAAARNTMAWQARYMMLGMMYGRSAALFVRATDYLTTAGRVYLMPLLGKAGSTQHTIAKEQWSVIRKRLSPV